MKILVVEDDYLIKYMLADLLTEQRHTVVEAANGATAFEKLVPEGSLDKTFNAVITDCNMPPGKSGLWFLQQLNESGVRLPCLLHSSCSIFYEEGVEFNLQKINDLFSFARYHTKGFSYEYINEFLATIPAG